MSANLKLGFSEKATAGTAEIKTKKKEYRWRNECPRPGSTGAFMNQVSRFFTPQINQFIHPSYPAFLPFQRKPWMYKPCWEQAGPYLASHLRFCQPQ